MLYEKLKKYAVSGVYPMHMPGHKRNASHIMPGFPYEIDITEVHGFDNLHDPRGVLKETAELAANLYGSDRAFLLVNGSTVGILAAIGAVANKGKKILIAGSCHVSVHNAVTLFGLNALKIVPETDESVGIALDIKPEAVESALESDKEIKLVVVTSPTYEGVVSDIGTIAKIAHEHGVPIFVDCAHGAHLGFSTAFPESAVKSGADIVVMSLHKTLPALTQCSLLHISGGRVDASEVARMLSVLQTTSPSYVLMASIDTCLRFLISEKDWLFSEYERNLEQFNREVMCLQNLFVWQAALKDPGKIVIVTKGAALSGFELANLLRMKYKIELELARPNYAVAMTSVCDTSEGFTRLANALISIDH